MKVGVRSTALLFGQQTPVWLSGFSLATLTGLGAAGHAVGLGENGMGLGNTSSNHFFVQEESEFFKGCWGRGVGRSESGILLCAIG